MLFLGTSRTLLEWLGGEGGALGKKSCVRDDIFYTNYNGNEFTIEDENRKKHIILVETLMFLQGSSGQHLFFFTRNG